MRRAKTSATPEREAEVTRLLSHVRDLAEARRDIAAVGLVGSWSRGTAGMESDVDLIVLTAEKEDYLRNEAWMRGIGGIRMDRTRDWGPLYTERRFVTESGLEVESGIAPPEWAATDPPDPNISEDIGNGGLKPLYDPDGILERLIRACREADGPDNA